VALTERQQRQVDRLLDGAESSITDRDWPAVAEAARSVLAVDPDNPDASAYLKMAEANLGVAPATDASSDGEPPSVLGEPSVEQLASFAGGRYEVRRLLGEGGKKRVYLAHDTSLDRDVAFALIKTEGLDATGRERIAREAQAMGRLGTHPHIVTIFEIGEEGGSPYVVNELLAGGDVEGELEAAEGALPLARTLEIAKAVCRGLAFAHERGIVHRDLKPGNVWLTEDGVAKIGDFGLAVSLDRSRLTQHGMMVGTVAYMPPEQALGGEVTPQADLYSLGAVLYELVTGRPPFQADDPTAVISQHVNTAPVRPSLRSQHCPPDLEALILQLLAKVPDDRPASAAEVLAALEAVDPEARSACDSQLNPLDRLARGVFVGREAELERLRNAADEAFAGRGSVVMLVGEPGIGKTRTAQELETYARMRSAQMLWGRAHEASGAPAYWPWVQVGRAWGRANDVRALAKVLLGAGSELVRLFPELPSILGQQLEQPTPATDASAQFLMFDAYANFLRTASADSPIVVVLDDLHWADRPTLLLLQHLAQEVHNARLLLVGTYRDTELARTHPLSETVAELNREGGFDRIVLRGLAEPETRAYLATTIGREPSAELVTRIHDETEGNPFFLAEVVNLMTEEGSLEADSVSDVALPDGVREALGRRLDRLATEANDLLAIGSVVGREFEYETLQLLSEHDDEALLALIEAGLDARVIEERDRPGRYRFTHALMQETLLAELSTTRLVRLHGRVGEALEAQYGDRAEERAAELARHFADSATLNQEHAERALRYSMLAGEQAERALAPTEAARLYERSLAIVRDHRQMSGDEAAVSESLGRALVNGGAVQTGLDHLRHAMDLMESSGDVVGLARTALFAIPAAPVPERAVLRRRGLDALGDADIHLRSRLLVPYAGAGGVTETWDEEAERDAQLAAELAHEHGFLDVIADIRGRETHRSMVERRWDDAIRQASEAYEAYSRLGDRVLAAHQLADITGVQIFRGDLDAATEVGWRCLEASRGVAIFERYTLLFLLSIYTLRDDHASIDDLSEHPNAHVDMGAATLLRHDVQHGMSAGDALERLPETLTNPVLANHFRAFRTYLLWLAGDRARASAEFAHLMDELRALPAGPWAGAIGYLDDASALLGPDEVVRELYERVSTDHEVRSSGFAAGSLDRSAGVLALRLDLIEEAEQHFRTGLEWCERERCPVEAGRCLQGLAEVAERRGDRDQAMEQLDRAGELFSRHGAML
jgi:tetratricopeptide (TPR) repeat protein